LEATLEALAAQDYPHLTHAFFVIGAPGGAASDPRVDATTAEITAVLPGAIVRSVVGNPGYGPTQNEAARMVEGDNGLFLFLHDDVALAPNAVSVMVAEMGASNAALVGPKLVDWDDPSLLQHVGLGVDRSGEVDPVVLPGERDQEQHDAVGDVFCVPSACMLVRADVFRRVGGFNSEIDFGGEEIDLCWRLHLTGGRVMVVPSAVARHRERFSERNTEVDLAALRERHRVQTVLTGTAGSRLAPVVLLLVGLSLIEAVVGVFSGRTKRALVALATVFGTLVRFGSLRRRRAKVQSLRVVSDAEIHDLQVQGSARVVSFLRARRARTDAKRLESRIAAAEREKRARTTIAVFAFLGAVFVVGVRRLVVDGVTFVGQFVPFTESWRSLGAAYRLGWWPGGFGSATPAPTGTALVGVATFFSLGNPAVVRTVAVVGLGVVGVVGMWWFGRDVTQSARARAGGTLAYAMVPLHYEAVATGRWSVLAAYAAVPWVLLAFSRANDVLTATAADVLRRALRLGLVVGAVAAFEASFVPVVVAAAIAYMIATAMCTGVRSLRGLPGVVAASVVVGLLLNFPWIGHYVRSDWWSVVVGADPGVGRNEGILRVLSFDSGRAAFAPAILVLYGVVAVAVVVARDTRFVWAVRGAVLAAVFAGLAVAADSRLFGFPLPETGVLLAFAAGGLALGVVALLDALENDVRGARFGWRQPLAALAALAVLVPVIPLAVNAADGRWNQPRSSLDTLLMQLAKNPDEGDYRILYLGHPDLLPAAPRTLATAGDLRLGYAVTDDGIATLFTQWSPEETSTVRTLENALSHLVSGDTPRVGRLVAPLGVRYVVVPRIDGARSTRSRPIAVPEGLVDALRVQLDLRRQYESADLLIYENTAWVPTVAQLSVAGAQASATAGMDELVLSDLRGATPAKVGFVPGRATQRLEVGPGVVNVAVPPSPRWALSIDGSRLASRPAFGATTGFDVPETVAPGSRATLRYDRPFLQVAFVVTQFVLWCFALFIALGLRLRRRRPVPVRIERSDDTPLTFGIESR
jgi:GT2 family glycosyltransferase